MSARTDELRAKALAEMELARRSFGSESILHLLHAAEYDMQADELDDDGAPDPHFMTGCDQRCAPTRD